MSIRKVAVLGAGVMGAQIAAHLVNANVETLLFELPACVVGASAPYNQDVLLAGTAQDDPNGNVNKALAGLKKLDPAPLATPAKLAYIQPANYEQHLEQLRDCDLVIEAIAERMDYKADLYRRVAPVTPPGFPSSNWRRLFLNTCAIVFAGCISSTHRATCIWSN